MNDTSQQPLPSVAPLPQQIPVVLGSPALLAKIEAVFAKLDAAAKAEEAKAAASVKTFFAKHWPWMAGVAVAATRFIHL